ncbi:MAG: LPS export ABC transporter permease LptG [Gammaproteobacteria bacterium]|nr:LPS export ABC transporter permease LptG [Gammaproteobacteria bacterium]
MSILQRYIARTLIASSALVILAMTGLIFLINFLEELRDVGNGDYGFLQALLHVVLEMPHALYQFFPMMVLLGGVLGLGVLASNQELVVMRAAGVSVRKIAGAIVLAALFLITIATGIGETLAPKATHIAEMHKDSAQNGGQAVATVSGVWLHEGNNFLHITRVIGLAHLEGVTRYQFDRDHRLLAAYYVKSLDLHNGQWLLHDVVKTSFVNNLTKSEHMAQSVWDLALNPHLLNVGLIEPSEMSLTSLYEYSHHLTENGLRAGDFEFEFWKRIFQPLTTLVMILLALPFVLRSSRSVTMGWRVLFGITIGFTFYMLNAFLGQFSLVFQFSPLIAAVTPTLLFALLGYIFVLKFKN